MNGRVMEREKHLKIEQEFEYLLRRTRRRVHGAVIRSRLHAGLERGISRLIWLAIAYAAGCWIASMLGWMIPLTRGEYGFLAGLVVIVPVAISIVKELWRRPTLSEAAERLDLSVQDHNRIATAIDLVRQERQNLFSQAAIQDGLTALRRFNHEKPYVPYSLMNRKKTGYQLVVFVLLTAATILLDDWTNKPMFEKHVPENGLAMAYSGDVEKYKQFDKAIQPVNQMKTVQRLESGRVSESLSQRPEANRLSDRTVGELSNGRTNSCNYASDKTASGTKSDSAETSPSTPRENKGNHSKQIQKKENKGNQTSLKKKDEKNKGSVIGSGNGGHGMKSTIENSWSTHEQSADTDLEEEQAEQNVEEQQESNTQRGGIQPLLKDRRAAPSRDLGKDEQEGEPGTGRGGPSPVKKSRGTASLVLGVPMPDFIKGRVAPGVTKVTQERTSPVTSSGTPAKASPVKPSSYSEGQQRRYEVPWRYTAVVCDYLITLHSKDQNDSNRRSER
jgi:hypothetical protein